MKQKNENLTEALSPSIISPPQMAQKMMSISIESIDNVEKHAINAIRAKSGGWIMSSSDEFTVWQRKRARAAITILYEGKHLK